MSESALPHAYPALMRWLLLALALLLIVGLFSAMLALSKPSRFVNALRIIDQGPSTARALAGLPVLDFTRFLYLSGPITPAAGPPHAPLFRTGETPVLAPSVFSDATGAVEVLSHDPPLTAAPEQPYRYGQPLHLLGWRTSTAGFTLFAVAPSREALRDLIRLQSAGWRQALFLHGLLLAGLTFTVYWLFNISLLSRVSLSAVQLMIVNVVFLVLYYSVLVLSGYPLGVTLPQTLLILVAANAVFIPLSLALRSRAQTGTAR